MYRDAWVTTLKQYIKLFYMAVIFFNACSVVLSIFVISTAMAIEHLLEFVFVGVAERVLQEVTGFVKTYVVVLIYDVAIKICKTIGSPAFTT